MRQEESVVQQELFEEKDKNIPNLNGLDVESSTDSSSSDIQKYKTLVSSVLATAAFKSSSWFSHDQKDEMSNPGQDSTPSPFRNLNNQSTPHEDDAKSHSYHNKLSTIPDEASESGTSQRTGENEPPIKPSETSESVEVQRTKRNTEVTSGPATIDDSRQSFEADNDVSDSESSDEPFIAKLMKEADLIQRAKGRLERVAPFEESDSDDQGEPSGSQLSFDPDSPIDFCAIFQCRSDGIIIEPAGSVAPMTAENIDRHSSVEKASDENDMSTIGGPMTKTLTKGIFSQGLPKMIPVSGDAEEVSTLWGGTLVSRDYRASLPSLPDVEEAGLSSENREGSVPSSFTSRRPNFLASLKRVEVFFALLTIVSSVALVILIVVFVA